MKRVFSIIAGALLLAVLAVAANSWWSGRASRKVVASGTLEARNISVGSKVGGRVTQVLVREGDHVDAGQLLVTFDGAELAAELKQARGRLGQARAMLKKAERGSRSEDIAQARAASAADGVAPGYRVQEVQQAQSDLKRAQADALNAEQNFDRINTLFQQGIAARQTLDDAQARLDAAHAQVQSLQNAVAAAEGRLRAARAEQQKVESGNRIEDIDAARADVLLAEGQAAQAEARWAEREVRSPASAVVEVLDLRPGDLLPANAPVARLLEADQLYAIVYVPQNEVGGRINVGQHAQVRVDAFPGQTFSATVEQIRQQAEFLPRNVQTADERQHQVFGIKLRVENPDHKLRAGIQTDVTFLEGK